MREALTASPENLRDLGAEGRRRIEDRHDVDKEAEKLGALFEDVVKRRKL